MVRRSGSTFSLPPPVVRHEQLNTIHEHADAVDAATADDDSAEGGQADDYHDKLELDNARLRKIQDALLEVVGTLRGLAKECEVFKQFACPAVGCAAHFPSASYLKSHEAVHGPSTLDTVGKTVGRGQRGKELVCPWPRCGDDSYACYKKHHEKCRWRDMRDHRPARRRTCKKRSLTVTQVSESTEQATPVRETQQGVRQEASTIGAEMTNTMPAANLPAAPHNPRKRSRSSSCMPPMGEPSCPSPEPDDPALSRRSSAALAYIPTPPTPKYVSDRAATPKAPTMRQGPFDGPTQQLPFGPYTQQLSFGQYTQPEPYDYESAQYLYPSPPLHPQASVQQPVNPGPTHGGAYPYALHLEEFGMASQQFVPNIPQGHHQMWTGPMHGGTDGLPQAATPDHFGMTHFQHSDMLPPDAPLVSPTNQAPVFYRVDESNGSTKPIAKAKGRRRLDDGSSTPNNSEGKEPNPTFNTAQNLLVFDVSTPETSYPGDPTVTGVIHDTMRDFGFCK